MDYRFVSLISLLQLHDSSKPTFIKHSNNQVRRRDDVQKDTIGPDKRLVSLIVVDSEIQFKSRYY